MIILIPIETGPGIRARPKYANELGDAWGVTRWSDPLSCGWYLVWADAAKIPTFLAKHPDCIRVDQSIDLAQLQALGISVTGVPNTKLAKERALVAWMTGDVKTLAEVAPTKGV